MGGGGGGESEFSNRLWPRPSQTICTIDIALPYFCLTLDKSSEVTSAGKCPFLYNSMANIVLSSCL